MGLRETVRSRLLGAGLSARDLWVAGSMSVAAGFLLAGYEFVRSPSNTLFKAAWGADRLPIVMALMPLGVLTVLYVYSRILSRVARGVLCCSRPSARHS